MNSNNACIVELVMQVTGGASVTLVGTNFGAYDTAGLWYALCMLKRHVSHFGVYKPALQSHASVGSSLTFYVHTNAYKLCMFRYLFVFRSRCAIGMRNSDQQRVQTSNGSLAHLLHVVRCCLK